MGRINRRIYATRRKRSPAKLGLPSGHIPNMINTGVAGVTNPYEGGRGTQQSQLYTQERQPPYLGGNSDEAGVGGGKTYTITEA